MSMRENLAASVGDFWQQLSTGWQQLRDRADRALTRFTSGRNGEQREVVGWGLLPVNLEESAERLRITLEVPGMDRENFTIEVQGDQLVVRGEKRHERHSRHGHYHLQECAYGSFTRIVPLPAPVNESGAEASYRRGVLTVELPKRTSGHRRRVSIQ